MYKTKIRRIIYHIRHNLLTTNNIVMLTALVIAAGWAVGSVNVMERNYKLQRSINQKEQELILADLEVATLRYEQKYYKSDEYKELAVRKTLGLALPGETAIILPPNSKAAKNFGLENERKSRVQVTNTEQWMNFLFGASDDGLQD